jgi:hypothetical protein
MSFTSTFDKVVTKADAFDAYIKANITWLSDYQGSSTTSTQVMLYSDRPLTSDEQQALQTLIDNYTDPAVWLTFDHVETMAMHSHYTDDPDNLIINNQDVLQTFIFCNMNNPPTVMDSMKTIVEYKCTNIPEFANTTQGNISGNITLSMYDLTRDVVILNQVIDLGEIATKWNNLAMQGNVMTDTVFRSTQFFGLMNKVANYDCVWQLRGNIEPPGTFTYRVNGMQHIFYNIE